MELSRFIAMYVQTTVKCFPMSKGKDPITLCMMLLREIRSIFAAGGSSVEE
jgi:hypothetical protein